MPLRTVRVPGNMEPLFARAEEVVSAFFADRVEAPERGAVEIFGERYVLVRAGALSVEFFALARELYGAGREEEAEAFARNILFDLAHGIGKSDAQNFQTKMNLTDPLARLSAGPVHFAYTGWASVDIRPESRPTCDEDFLLLYDHPYSFEADAWLRAGQRAAAPVCIMNAGYSSGWCEQSFGVRLVSCEVTCRACGDDACRFVMAHPSRAEAHVARFVRSVTPALAGGDGKPVAYSVPDLFARKRIEEELRRARDELEQRVAERTAELTAANERLTAEISERAEIERQLRQAHKLEAVGRLAGGVAHDFNNLLGVVLTRADMLERRVRGQAGNAPGDVVDDVREIKAAARRAANLTRQLLAFGRVQPTQMEALDVNEVVAHLMRTLLPLIGEDIVIVDELSKAPLRVETDRGQLEQALMNLVVNARDAMPRGGTLTIATRAVSLDEPRRTRTGELPAGRYVALVVRDTGTGMDEGVVTKIFDPFFTTKEAGAGTGLGLATVYGIVQRSGGAIDVKSSPGAGSTFEILLPAVEATAQVASEVHVPAEPDALPRGRETVLLVEDQEELRDVIADVLAFCGYRVQVATSVENALAIAGSPELRVDLLLADVVMPRLAGPELAARVQALQPHARVLFISGYAPDAQHVALAAMSARVLAKPFLPVDLAQAVRACLDST